MLVSDPLHSLNASPLHADWSAAEGLKPANAALGKPKSTKPRAAIPAFLIVTIFFSQRVIGDFKPSDRECAVTAITERRLSGFVGTALPSDDITMLALRRLPWPLAKFLAYRQIQRDSGFFRDLWCIPWQNNPLASNG